MSEFQPAPIGEDVGRQMHALAARLYPICRSITGDGVRQTLAMVSEQFPLQVQEVPTGTKVFDWTVPREWNIRDAYIKNADGERVVDFRKCNLHVVNYSVPVKTRLTLEELKPHLFSLPEYPDWVPYRTSYYSESWGFCLSHNQLLQLKGEKYEVCIDSSLQEGSLTYGEYFLPGESEDEVLISCHTCHPSLANDNLSGIALATFLARHLAGASRRRYSYRFLFIPGTIGSITWLARNQQRISRVKHGLVAVCVGDPGKMVYKKTRGGNAEIDRAVEKILQDSGEDHEVTDFYPFGYDERQYNSPGIKLNVGSLSRSSHGRFPQYHTSADNLDLIHPEYLADSLAKYLSVLYVLEHNRRYVNQNPCGEPQLGKRGLYAAIGGQAETKSRELAMLWVLNMSDGEHDLLDIARCAAMKFEFIKQAADLLHQQGLLKVAERSRAAQSHD